MKSNPKRQTLWTKGCQNCCNASQKQKKWELDQYLENVWLLSDKFCNFDSDFVSFGFKHSIKLRFRSITILDFSLTSSPWAWSDNKCFSYCSQIESVKSWVLLKSKLWQCLFLTIFHFVLNLPQTVTCNLQWFEAQISTKIGVPPIHFCGQFYFKTSPNFSRVLSAFIWGWD